MPFVLIVIGVILLITAIHGTSGKLGSMLSSDIFGAKGFVYWFLAIFIIGAIGYYRPLKPVSNLFLVLVVLILFISEGGFFQKFTQAIQQINPSGAGTSSQTPGSPTTLYNGPNAISSLTSPDITQAPTTTPLPTEIPQ